MIFIYYRRAICCFVPLLISVCGLTAVAQTTTTADTETRPAASENKAIGNAEEPKPTTEAVSTEPVSAEPVKNGISETKTVAATLNVTARPNPQNPTDKWRFAFSPYIWLPGISGRAGLGDLVVDVNSSLGDSNVHLNFGFMGTFEARKNKFISLTDLQYSNLGTERPNPGILFSSATADFKTFILDPEVGYRVAENPDRGNYVDVLGGIRYYHLRTDLNLAAGLLAARSATRSRGWVDAVGGLRSRIHLTPRFFLTGKVDLGGGGSKFTYQLAGAAGFQVSKSIALLGGYRYLHVNYDRDNFLFDMGLSGPIFGVGFRF